MKRLYTLSLASKWPGAGAVKWLLLVPAVVDWYLYFFQVLRWNLQLCPGLQALWGHPVPPRLGLAWGTLILLAYSG